MYYIKEKIDPNIKYIKNSEINRIILTDKLGEQNTIIDKNSKSGQSYIEIKLKERIWRTCFTFEWLYRTKPELNQIEDLSI